MNREQQGQRNNARNRRKNGRNSNRKKQVTTTDNIPSQHEEEKELSSSEINNEKDQESVLEQSDNEEQQQQNDSVNIEQTKTVPMHVEDEQEPMILVKQRNKSKPLDKTSDVSTGKDEHIVPVKPQASVAPVKQTSSVPPMNNPKSTQDNHLKTNGHTSRPSNLYTFSAFNPLPPRFQQQRQQKEAEFSAQKFRRRRGGGASRKATIPPGSAARSNEFIPASFQPPDQQQQHQQQQQEQQLPSPSQLQYVNNERTEVYMHSPDQQQSQPQQQELSINNDYSSESEILADLPINGVNNSLSPIFPASVGSQSSLQRLDLLRSLSSSHGVLDKLISIFDTVPFTTDELDVILSKIASRHISTKSDLQRLLSSTKSDKTFERIVDETYHSQAKILALELQCEKNRVLELTKSNTEMENTIRQFQQQQPTNVVQYQQMILSYQMQLQRLADEHTRLQHQLHAYSMLPATINELKQQQHILTEKIRQMTIRNSALENEVADSERASKHAAEIYKKADSQKQERIEQMIADINKYKKLDKELTNLRQKHSELEKNFSTKIDEITVQRDVLQKTYDELKDKVRQYEQMKVKYDQLMKNPSNKAVNKLQEELTDLKTQNDQLRQRNWKIMEELNKLLHEQQQTQDNQ